MRKRTRNPLHPATLADLPPVTAGLASEIAHTFTPEELAGAAPVEPARVRAARPRKPTKRERETLVRVTSAPLPSYSAERDVVRELAAEIEPKLQSVRGPEDVLQLVGSLRKLKREVFMVLLLNARHDCIGREIVSLGSLNASIVHPREVFRPAIVASAASVVLVHNHPSGDPEPSEEDLSITRRLTQAGELVGVGVLDHVIIGSRGVVSMRARQLL